MSVINKLLQDLEARQGAGAERILTDHVRSLPPGTSPRPWRGLAWGAVALVVLAAAAALAWLPAGGGPPAAPGPAIVKSAVAPSINAPPANPGPAPVPATAGRPESPPEAPGVPPAGTPSPADLPLAAAPAPAGRLEARGLKVATELFIPRSLHERTAPPAVAARSPSPEAGSRPAPISVRAAGGPPRIEKNIRESSAQERAANDYRQAVALLNDGRPDASLESLRAALRSDASHAEARLLLSRLLLEKRRLEEARAVLQEGVSRDPAQPRFAMPLARTQVEMGDPGSAAETLARAAQAAAGNADYRGFHAAVLQQLGRHKEAIGEFQEALRLLPESGLWWMGLGISLEADGQRGPARDALRRARETGRLAPELDRFVQQKLQALTAPP